jgi:hypothetical protein
MPGHGSVFDPALLDDPDAAAELLARWDELDARALERIRAHPLQGPRLRRLELAESWLVESARAANRDARRLARGEGVGSCPRPEELYDHGRGPGYSPLPEARRREIEAHVASCLDCELALSSLQRRPPPPLDLAPPAETAAPSEAPHPAALPSSDPPRPRLVRPARPRRLVPLAIAASALALLGLWTLGRLGGDAGASGLDLPEAPLLRGESASPLVLPRGRLLAVPADAPAWLDLPHLRRFEIALPGEADAPPAGAEDSFRVVLSATDGGAFDAGRAIADHRGDAPTLGELDLTGAPLAPGLYTWEAWRRVNGLDERLGSRDFEVVEDPLLWERLLALDARAAGLEPAPRTRAEAIRLLHERGHPTDARALARGLPPSAERDLYLGRNPGR